MGTVAMEDTDLAQCAPALSAGELNLLPNFQRGGPDKSSYLRGGLLGKRG